MNKPHDPVSAQSAAFARAQQFMSPSPVPSISTELLSTADGELNRELNHFLFDPNRHYGIGTDPCADWGNDPVWVGMGIRDNDRRACFKHLFENRG